MENIFVLYGENKESLWDFQKKVTNTFLDNEIDDFNLIRLNMLETSIEDLVYEASSSGFLSNKKVIIADNAVFLQSKMKKSKIEYKLESLESYLDNINPEVMIIFICDDVIDSRKKINKKIKTSGQIKNFENFKEADLTRFIIEYLSRESISISKENANFIIGYTQLDYARIKRELEKLSLYCKEKGLVEEEDIRNVLVKSLEYDIFSLVNHVFSKNYVGVRSIFSNLELNKEEPIGILALIVSQIRVYYKVKILLQQNYGQKDIASKLKIHPYRVQLATQAVYNYKLEDLFTAIIEAKNCDKDLKSSYLDKYIILDLFINKLMRQFQAG